MILAVKEDSKYADTIKSLADCDGLKVAVKEGATSYNVAQSFLDENPDVSYEIVQYKDTVGCVSDLLAGRVDVVVNDLLNQKILSKEYDGTKIVCDPFTHAENAIAVQKGKDDLLAFINQCIDEYYEDGTYDALWKNGSMLPVKGKKRQQKKIQQQKMQRLLNKQRCRNTSIQETSCCEQGEQ